IWWIKTALQTGQDPFFMPNLVHPDGVPAPLLWSIPLQSFPAWLLAFVLPLPLAFNLPALITLALNGWAMCLLVRYLLGGRGGFRANPYVDVSTASALVAGLIFMIYP